MDEEAWVHFDLAYPDIRDVLQTNLMIQQVGGCWEGVI